MRGKVANIKSINEGVLTMTEFGNKCRRIDILNKLNIGVYISIDTLSKIDLYLIPIVIDGKIGFIDKEANLIVRNLFDKHMGTFDNENSLVRVCINDKWGVINAKGNVIIPADYSMILISDDQQLFTISKDRKTGVIDANHDIVVDFGEYHFIDGFDSGLARVKIKEKWGIINTEGEIVLAIEFDNIWNFYKKNRSNTHVEKDGCSWNIYFNNLQVK